MPYTNVWSSTSPPGSQDAKTADDEFRKFRLDIEERMEDKFITDVVVDPWVVKPEILGNVTGKSITIHHSALQTRDSTTKTALYSEHSGTDLTWWAPLIIPDGVTITTASFLVNRNGATDFTCRLAYNDFSAAPTTTIVGSISTTVNGITIINITTGLPHVKSSPNRAYFIEVLFSGGITSSRFYSAQILYNSPDCRNTL